MVIPSQVIDLSIYIATSQFATAFYRSGFDEAVALIVDGAGTFIDLNVGNRANNCLGNRNNL